MGLIHTLLRLMTWMMGHSGILTPNLPFKSFNKENQDTWQNLLSILLLWHTADLIVTTKIHWRSDEKDVCNFYWTIIQEQCYRRSCVWYPIRMSGCSNDFRVHIGMAIQLECYGKDELIKWHVNHKMWRQKREIYELSSYNRPQQVERNGNGKKINI